MSTVDVTLREWTRSTVSERFAAAVERWPDNVAVGGERALSFRELGWWASAVAQRVFDASPPRHRPVALLIDGDALGIAALVGVLEAGCFYAALHPALPAATLATTLADSGAGLLLTAEAHEALAREIAGDDVRVLTLPAAGAEAERRPRPPVSSHHPVAVMHTSGSTGGVTLRLRLHRDLLYRVTHYTDLLGIDASDRLSLLFHPAYAAAESDIFCALLNGAAVLPIDLADASLSTVLLELAAAEVSIFHPSVHLLRQLVREGPNDWGLPRLRVIAVSGSKLSPEDVEGLLARVPGSCRVHHRYSSTELGPISNCLLERGDAFPEGRVPIGSGVPMRDVALVGDGDAPVAEGEVGEFVVRGDFFDPDPWTPGPAGADWPAPTHRVCRSGDLGVRLASGAFAYVGRKDAMVKVLGYRVELGAVEGAIVGHAAVRDCAVFAAKDEASLIAHCEVEPSFDAVALRRYLRERLPAWQVPSRVQLHEALPRTPTGKVDRGALRRLPAPDAPAVSAASAADATLADAIRANWGELFGARVAPDEDFFELGGTSLQARSAVAFAERRSGQGLSVTCLYANPTAASFAAAIERGAGLGFELLVPMQAPSETRTERLFLIPAFGKIYDLIPLARAVSPPYAVYGFAGDELLATPGSVDVVELSRRYCAELVRVHPEGPITLCGYSMGGTVAIEMALQLAALGREVARVLVIDTRPVSLSWWLEAKVLLPRPRKAVRSLVRRVFPGHKERLARRTARRPFLAALRAYSPRRYPGAVHLFLAAGDGRWNLLAAWRYLVTGELTVSRVPGTHRNLIDVHVEPLADALNDVLGA